MQPPPPLPRARFSPLLLPALLALAVAVVARGLLSSEGEIVATPLFRLLLAATGAVLGSVSFCFAAVVLLQRQRAWAFSLVIGAGAVITIFLLTSELTQNFRDLLSSMRPSSAGTGGDGQADTEGLDTAQAAIPREKTAITAANIAPEVAAWGEENLVRPYEERGHHDPAWDNLARQLIRGTALELAGSPASPGTARLRAWGLEIQQTPCDDPWVLFLARRPGVDDPDFAEAMAKSAATLSAAGYPPFPVWLARTEALRGLRNEQRQAAGILVPDCLDALQHALSAHPLTFAEYHAWAYLFSIEPITSLLDQDYEGVCRTIESVPGVEPWFPLYVRGRGEIAAAWLARGSGWANSVSPRQWELFGQHLVAARTTLERACVLNPAQPEPGHALITVSLGNDGLPEMRAAFERSIRAQFDYRPSYETYRYGLLPRWHGSEAALLAFGRACLATKDFQTDVPWQMYAVTRAIAKDRDDPDAYYPKSPWNDLKTMFDGYVSQGDPVRRNYYLSAEAVIAGYRLDRVVADLLKQVDYHVDPQIVEEWNLPVHYTPRMVTLTSPARTIFAAGERADSNHPEVALEKFLAAQKMPGLLPITTDYLNNRVTEERAIVALNRTPWQSLIPPQDLTGWKAGDGAWHVTGPDALSVDTESQGALLTRLEPVGDTWELRGELVLSSRAAGGRTEAAFFCGPPGDQQHHGFSLRFWKRASGWTGISLARGFGDLAVSRKIDSNGVISFFIRLANHELRVQTNEGLWYADQPLPNGATIDSTALLGLGSTGGGERTVQFRKLEWRGVGGVLSAQSSVGNVTANAANDE